MGHTRTIAASGPAVFALSIALLLGACTEAPAADMTEARRIEAATARMKAEQARTDREEARKRAEAKAAYEKSLRLPEGQRGIIPPPTGR